MDDNTNNYNIVDDDDAEEEDGAEVVEVGYPNLIAFLNERLPEVGLDIDTYVPYALGIITSSLGHEEEEEKEEEEGDCLNHLITILQSSAAITDENGNVVFDDTHHPLWTSWREDIIYKLQQDKELRVQKQKEQAQRQNAKLQKQLQQAKLEQETALPKQLKQAKLEQETALLRKNSTSTSVPAPDNLLRPWIAKYGQKEVPRSCRERDSRADNGFLPTLPSNNSEPINGAQNKSEGDTTTAATTTTTNNNRHEPDKESGATDGNVDQEQYTDKRSRMYEYWLSKITADGWELGQSPFRNDKNLVLLACHKKGQALQFAAKFLQKDKEVALAACQQDGLALQYTHPELRSDKEVVLTAVRSNPDALKFAMDGLNQDPDCLVASGLWDQGYCQEREGQEQIPIRIVLSTRFALAPGSSSKATQFAVLLKENLPHLTRWLQRREYLPKNSNFVVYSPNAFDKSTCDPEWTTLNWPCRGTYETCQMTHELKTGVPTRESCWRYSFRHQLEQAKKENGFLIQLVETGTYYTDGRAQELGQGQTIERHMAEEIPLKIFRVHAPVRHRGKRYEKEHQFEQDDIRQVLAVIRNGTEGIVVTCPNVRYNSIIDWCNRADPHQRLRKEAKDGQNDMK